MDDDGDGRADRAIEFADSPREGAQGMLWEGDSLFVSGEGGLRRFRVSKDGNHAASASELLRAARTGGEHESHAIKRGPDGWLYWLLGNSAGVRANFAQLDTSPIKNPLAGCVVRFSPDLKSTEIVADGFRNAYDFDFNRAGDLFTFDSDNERCVSLPWYEGCRFYHVIPGGHYGWLNPQRAETWRTPPYDCDIVAPILDLGRGSPTAVVCYHGRQFPARYRDGLFLFDWTFGRVYFVALQRAGASYRATKEVFLECTGENGFAPTALLCIPKPATSTLPSAAAALAGPFIAFAMSATAKVLLRGRSKQIRNPCLHQPNQAGTLSNVPHRDSPAPSCLAARKRRPNSWRPCLRWGAFLRSSRQNKSRGREGSLEQRRSLCPPSRG